MAENKHYPRPPITEAVIELRFAEVLSARDMERLRDRFKARYFTIEQIRMFEVTFEAGSVRPPPPAVNVGFKMTDKNAVDILMIKPSSLATIRLAPYESWENLRSSAQENWALLERVLNTKKRVTRMGTRFINRIDIPTGLLTSKNISELFPTHIMLGRDIAREIGNFMFSVAAIHSGTGAKLTINSAVLDQPALLEHTSITLDTDAFWDADIPQRIDEMWSKADKLREAKNAVFENSITNHLRNLFQ